MEADESGADMMSVMGKLNHSRRTAGALIINADDWGRDRTTTDRTFNCISRGMVSAVSAMMFMEDSERAALMTRQHGIDTGLHLNLTTLFSTGNCSSKLREHQERLARYLLRHRLMQVMFHPRLTNEFEYVVKMQLDEFSRLYGEAPGRVDGHHHMHLCANVLVQGLLPQGAVVRRSFSFEIGEKSLWNRLYRRWIDSRLARRHRITDYFFSLPPLFPESRLQRIFSLAHDWVVEVEAHPVNGEEYRFLTEKGIARFIGSGSVSSESVCPLGI
jgi:chitin disaccharide deacetylase